ncbi:tape measure protein [Vibrio echinoideorum]|uniref:tape measure protein n=1 Tax=Vibrio echinoideorum TaxID=2100116 RepID=UPI0010810032|nr:tape measure protein [Vibrio echinoideorum]
MSDLKFTLRFDAENKQFIGQVNQAGGAVTKLGGSANTTQGKLKGLSTQSTQTSANLGSLKNQVLGVASGFSALYAANQAADKLGQYQDIRTQITALVGGQEEWIETEQYLNQVSKEHNKTLVDMSGNYARLVSLQEAGLVTQKESRAIFEGMSNVQSQAGASTTQLGQSMYGLSQALASPIVRAEELNQVVEPMPGLLNKLDEAAGLSAGGFRRMMLAGEVTSHFFKETLITALSEYDGAAARTADNINAKYAENTRAYEKAVVAFEAPISDSFSAVLEASAGTMELFAENADLVTTIIELSLVTALSRGSTAVLAMTAAKVQSITVTRTQEQANLTELRSLEAKLAAEVRELEVMKLSNNQKFRAIGAETTLAAKRVQLTATTTTLTAAQTRLNVVARAGSGIMAMLGGPAGIAMMAAGAIGYFALSNTKAEKETKGLSDQVDVLLGKMNKLREKELNNALTAVTDDLESTRLQIETLSKQTGTNNIEERLAQLDVLRQKEQLRAQEAIELEDKLYALRNKPEAPKKESSSIEPKLEEQANKLLENLRKQNALYGETSEAAKLKYEIEYGSLKGINEELAKKLMLEARSIDEKIAKDKPKDTSAIDAFYDESDQLQTAYLQRLSMQASLESQAVVQEKAAFTEKSIALSESFQAAYEQAIGNQELMDALEREYFANRELLYTDHEMNLSEIEKKAAQERFDATLQNAAMLTGAGSQLFGGMAELAKVYAGKQSGIYRLMFAASKGFAIAQAGINLYQAISNATTVQPWYASIPAIATATSQGATLLAGLKGSSYQGQAHDGIERVPKKNEGTWLLRENEMVLNPTQADNFRWMSSMMKEMKHGMQMARGAQIGQVNNNQASSAVNVSSPPVNVVFVDDPEQINKYLNTDEGERAVMRIVERNKG